MNVKQSKIITQVLSAYGQAYLAVVNEGKDSISFSCFDCKEFIDSPNVIAVFSVKKKGGIA